MASGTLKGAIAFAFAFIVATPWLAVAGTSVIHPDSVRKQFEVRAVSSRSDTISGGDVLVELTAGDSAWTAELNGRDVTLSFRSDAGSGRLLALLTGLKTGKNLLSVRIDQATDLKLALLNHSRVGPIFSGPHQRPFICRTLDNELGPPLDADCSSRTVVQYYYKSAEPDQPTGSEAIKASLYAAPGSLSPGFKAYDLSGPPPSDIAQTVTSDGRNVQYIVRREVGTINRAIYDIQFLHAPGDPLPSPWTRPTPGWNGRLVYVFGGGLGAGYHQGTLGFVGTDQEPLLAQGYAVATSTLNIFGNTGNDRVSAETLSMVREHFIENFGRPIHTIGIGASGGSMQAHLIAQNYPGLLDGIIPSFGPPDAVTTVQSVTDCALLANALKESKHQWTEAQKTAVSGFATWHTCSQRWHHLSPKNCNDSIPKNLIYDRVENPKGIRCTLYDNAINVFGRNPRTGFAYRPLDNVGVQYGLDAFNRRMIDAERFIEINERVGGYDDDGNIVSARTQADPEALRLAYQRGLVVTGGGGLRETPIIDWRQYLDDLADSHVRSFPFATRARLIAANGNADNHVIQVSPRPRPSYFDDPGETAAALRDLVRQMDRWLDNIAADNAAEELAAKVSRNKPASLADGCKATDGERIDEPATYDGPGRCNQLYPSYGDPRRVAGAPLANDVLKCALKPIDPADYVQPLDQDQLDRLRAVFPTGVCDYTQRGVGQQVIKETWQKWND